MTDKIALADEFIRQAWTAAFGPNLSNGQVEQFIGALHALRAEPVPDGALAGVAADLIEQQRAEIAALQAEVAKANETVRRVQASARTIDATRSEIYAGYVKAGKVNTEAVATLDSEREANAILTAENTALCNRVDALKESMTRYIAAVEALGKSPSHRKDNYFEAPLSADGAIERWQELDRAGKQARTVLAKHMEMK